MEHERFRDWFSRVDELTAAQRKELVAVLSDPPEGAASLAAIELGVDDERRCPHCGAGGAVSRGKARGLRGSGARSAGRRSERSRARRCPGCTTRSGGWPGASLAEGETIKESAERCGIAPSTAHRWRHRFLAAVRRRTGLPGSSRLTRPSFWRAGKGSGSSTGSRAGAAARPANAVSRASRCRSWSPPIVAARPSAIPCPLSRRTA